METEKKIKVRFLENGEIKEVELIIGLLTVKERNEALRKATKIQFAGNIPQTTIDAVTLQEYTVLYAIKEPKEWKDLNKIGKIIPKDFDKLYNEIEKLNGVEEPFLKENQT